MLYELKQTGSKFLENSETLQALNELEILFRALDKSKCIAKVVLDLSLARGLDYYTGVIYEAVFKGATQVDLDYLFYPFILLFGLSHDQICIMCSVIIFCSVCKLKVNGLFLFAT